MTTVVEHISDQVKAKLLNEGWNEDKTGLQFSTLVEGFAPAGTVSDGARVVTLTLDETGRWLSRIDGWGAVQKDVDLRNFHNDPLSAIKNVIAH